MRQERPHRRALEGDDRLPVLEQQSVAVPDEAVPRGEQRLLRDVRHIPQQQQQLELEQQSMTAAKSPARDVSVVARRSSSSLVSSAITSGRRSGSRRSSSSSSSR